MKSIQEVIDYVENCSLEEFKALSSSFSKLHDVKAKRLKQVEEDEKAKAKAKLDFLLLKSEYQEPVYPRFDYDLDEMGDEQEDGSCVLTDEVEAKELISRLISQSYYYGHYFKWQGPGKYSIKPSWKYDCSGEVIYSAHYELSEAL